MAFFRQLLATPERQLSGSHERYCGAQATNATMIANPTLSRIFVFAPGLAIPGQKCAKSYPKHSATYPTCSLASQWERVNGRPLDQSEASIWSCDHTQANYITFPFIPQLLLVYLIVHGCTRLYMVVQGCICNFLYMPTGLQGFTRLYNVYKIVKGCIMLYKVVKGCIRLYKVV